MKLSKNKKLVVGFIGVIILLASFSIWYASAQNSPEKQTETTNDPITEEPVNLSPPTEKEKSAGDQQKEEIINNQSKPNNTESGQKKATVIITDAHQYDNVIEVRSFISNHYEDGTCTIKFTQGAKSFSKTTPAYRDATTTICTNPLIKRSEFPAAGDWQVTVSYKSSGASGNSEIKTVRIK